jgi:hypothetical protein
MPSPVANLSVMKILIIITILLSLMLVILGLIFILGLISKSSSHDMNGLGDIGSFIGGILGPILLILNMGLVLYLGTHINELLTKRTHDYNKMIKIDELKYAAYSSLCDVVDPIIFYNAIDIRTVNTELIKKAIPYVDRFWGNYNFLFLNTKDKNAVPILLSLCAKTSNSLSEMYNAKMNWDRSQENEFENKFKSSFVQFANFAQSIKVTLQSKIIN